MRNRKLPIRKTLRPGDAGTLRFVDAYGERLVCVRRRHDPARLRRYTTVELIVEDVALDLPESTVVGVRVGLDEPVMRHRVKTAGGRWNPRARLWELPLGAVRALALEDRIRAWLHMPTPMGTSDHDLATSTHS